MSKERPSAKVDARGRRRPENALPLLGRVIRTMAKGYPVRCSIVVICILASSLATLVGTLFLRTLIDDYITPLIGQASPDFAPLAGILFKLAAIYAVGILCGYLYNRLMVNVSAGTLVKIRKDAFDHMETLPIRYFDTHAHGDIMSVYTNDVDTLRQLLSGSIPDLIQSLVTVSITFVSMIILSLPLTLISVAVTALAIWISARLGGRSGGYFVKQQKNLGALNGYIEEMIGGQKVVKVFSHEAESIEGFSERNERLRESACSANSIANIVMPINNNLGHLSYVLIAVGGALLSLGGIASITLGTIVSFLTLNRNFSRPISQMSMQINSVVMAMAGAKRVFDLIGEEPEEDKGCVTIVRTRETEHGIEESETRTGTWAWKRLRKDGTAEYTRLAGEVIFQDVDFGYTEEKQILYGINLYAWPGQKIAFVGSTGAGKTTITNLINRFYEIRSGRITYDGIDIGDIRKSDLRRSLGIVLQETNLFSGTVLENIRYGRLDATDEDCRKAAKLANADSFIRRLPDGYNTMLTGDGANLSQGQRQLLAIARAAVADPPVLILDEATSSIDTRTEALVQEGMDHLMQGRTTFVIAHRLSTVRDASCIMVLENGRIIERGSHDELLEKKGRYYQLYTGNFAE